MGRQAALPRQLGGAGGGGLPLQRLTAEQMQAVQAQVQGQAADAGHFRAPPPQQPQQQAPAGLAAQLQAAQMQAHLHAQAASRQPAHAPPHAQASGQLAVRRPPWQSLRHSLRPVAVA